MSHLSSLCHKELVVAATGYRLHNHDIAYITTMFPQANNLLMEMSLAHGTPLEQLQHVAGKLLVGLGAALVRCNMIACTNQRAG